MNTPPYVPLCPKHLAHPARSGDGGYAWWLNERGERLLPRPREACPLGHPAAVLLSRKLTGAGGFLEVPDVPLLPAPQRGRRGAGPAARVSKRALPSEVLPPFPSQAASPSGCFFDPPVLSSGGGKVKRVPKGRGGGPTDLKPQEFGGPLWACGSHVASTLALAGRSHPDSKPSNTYLFIYALNWISVTVEERFAFLPGTWKATDLVQSWPKAAGSAVGAGSGDREMVSPHTGALTGCGLRRHLLQHSAPPGLGGHAGNQLVTMTCLSTERQAFRAQALSCRWHCHDLLDLVAPGQGLG